MAAFNGGRVVGALGNDWVFVGWVNVALTLIAALVFFRVRRTRSLFLAWVVVIWSVLFLAGPVSIWLFSGTMPITFGLICVMTSIMLVRASRAQKRLASVESGI